MKYMPSSFEILAGFLDRTDPEVEGRALEDPPPAAQEKLREFARGELPEAEQRELLDQLNRNRDWLPFLAEQVKALRIPSGGKT
jgi:hypothetical protein